MKNIFRPLCIFILALAPRIYQLGNDVINIDAPFWKENTYNFLGLFFQRRFGDMVITHHPGVTLMWLGGLGMKVFRALYLWTQGVPAPDTAAVYLTTHFAQKLPIALATSAFIVFVYWSVKKLVDERVAVIAAVLLALEPFFLAHSRVFHLDALLTVFMCSSVLALLLYLQSRNRRWLAGSGALAGLALLTKSTALFLLPFTLLLFGLDHFLKTRKPLKVAIYESRFMLGGFLVWSAALVAVFVLVWPAMWVGPLETLRVYFSGIFAEANATDPAFFASSRHVIFGRLTYSPGAYYYPLVLAFRLTPTTFIFGIIGVVAAVKKFLRDRWPIGGYLVLYLLFYVLMMALPAKKLDRYILPVLPLFCVLAACGIVQIFRRFALQRLTVVFVAVVVAVTAGTLYRLQPDYGFYFSPLFGGTRVGLQFDSDYWWGEGHKKVADYLNAKASAENIEVALYDFRSFAPFFVGRTLDAGGGAADRADYFVYSIKDRDGLELEHKIRVGGVDYWGIYKKVGSTK